MADQASGFGLGVCVHTYPQAPGEPPAHCDCVEEDQRICPLSVDIDPITGGGVCADWNDDRFCGAACADVSELCTALLPKLQSLTCPLFSQPSSARIWIPQQLAWEQDLRLLAMSRRNKGFAPDTSATFSVVDGIGSALLFLPVLVS